MNTDSNNRPSQEIRDRMAIAIQKNNIDVVRELLSEYPVLANADLRPEGDRDVFSSGLPLHQACQHNHGALAKVLLDHGADPNAAGPDPNDRPVYGMPLHYAAAEHQNYRLANRLLDHGATPNSYPHCDQSTIERMFYCARDAGLPSSLVRRVYARFLPDQTELSEQTVVELVGDEANDAVRLFARMVDLGGQPPFVVLVRQGFHDLAMEMVTHCSQKDGTPHDHPNSSVLNNVAGAARWYGYPELVRRLMDHATYQYQYEDVINTITVAIGSHNRDGDYSAYREIILMQLETLQANGDLERARNDPEFKPIYQVATDFTWHSNYGYRAEIAKPACYIDLAELLGSWGFDDIEYRDPKTKHSPLSAAVQRGHHPGIEVFIDWLLNNGADLRESDPDEVSPVEIAHAKGFQSILELLIRNRN